MEEPEIVAGSATHRIVIPVTPLGDRTALKSWFSNINTLPLGASG